METKKKSVSPLIVARAVRVRRRVLPLGGARDVAASLPLGPLDIEQRLKAERVQEALKALPGWRLAAGGVAIDRVRQFPNPGVAATFAAFAATLAGSRKQPIVVSLSAGQVGLMLPGRPVRGASGGLTQEVLDLAARLG
jgi:pterin-4a-carbinolamine dehydratase